ncbi:MAG TPA: amidase family protein [Myxococcota bacterium]|nr:amidase family protein [Myxococcota bacterium]
MAESFPAAAPSCAAGWAAPERSDSLAALDATAQAALVRRGELSPRELTIAACERIDRADGALGAVPVRFYDHALAAAERVKPQARFAGVPFLMKDVGARQAGQPYYAGNRALRDADYRADRDTTLGRRFREIGLVTVGNSNAPEFGLQSNTWPLAYGPTRNPWAPERAAGGSSGGACAAVAAGLVPVAHASDGAGSIRIPAAWCGLVGLKPSRDRIAWRHRGHNRPDVEFVVARSLRDTAAFLDELRPARVREQEPDAYFAALQSTPPRMRIGFTTRSPSGAPVDPDCAGATLAAAEALAANGHHVEEAEPATLLEYLDRALHGALLGAAEYRGCLDDLALRLGRPVTPDDVEPFLWELAHLDAGKTTRRQLYASRDWNRAWVARTVAWFDSYDLLLTPTVCEPAARLADLDPHRYEPLELLEKMVPHMAFTEPWNATGQPAISLPLAWSDEGLPLGVQLVAKPGRDDCLLAVAAELLPAIDASLPALHA